MALDHGQEIDGIKSWGVKRDKDMLVAFAQLPALQGCSNGQVLHSSGTTVGRQSRAASCTLLSMKAVASTPQQHAIRLQA